MSKNYAEDNEFFIKSINNLKNGFSNELNDFLRNENNVLAIVSYQKDVEYIAWCIECALLEAKCPPEYMQRILIVCLPFTVPYTKSSLKSFDGKNVFIDQVVFRIKLLGTQHVEYLHFADDSQENVDLFFRSPRRYNMVKSYTSYHIEKHKKDFQWRLDPATRPAPVPSGIHQPVVAHRLPPSPPDVASARFPESPAGKTVSVYVEFLDEKSPFSRKPKIKRKKP